MAAPLPPVAPQDLLAGSAPMELSTSEAWKPKRARRLSEVRAYSNTTSPAPERTNSEDAPICWICLDVARPESRLMQPCLCPRKETHCEFCDAMLPDWKSTLTPQCGADAPAVMNVNFDGKTYSFEVKPGAEGYRQFTEAIRRAFSLPEDSELNITFTCDEPNASEAEPPSLVHAGSLLTLQGAGAFDAAVHCASVSAARRIIQQRQLGGDAPPEPASPAPPAPSPHAPRPRPSGEAPYCLSTPGRGSEEPRHPLSPLPSPGGASTSSEGEPAGPGKRRINGFGRKLRMAFCDWVGPK